MEASYMVPVLSAAFLLIAITVSIFVRFAVASFSQNVRDSIRRHHVAHIVWFLASLFAALVLVTWLYPHFAGRRT